RLRRRCVFEGEKIEEVIAEEPGNPERPEPGGNTEKGADILPVNHPFYEHAGEGDSERHGGKLKGRDTRCPGREQGKKRPEQYCAKPREGRNRLCLLLPVHAVSFRKKKGHDTM